MNSPVRAFRHVGQAPLFLARGQGAKVSDLQGHSFIDLIMGWGTLILGHAHPSVVRAIRRQVLHGTSLGLTHQAEVDLAKAIVEAFPSIEQVRFTTSGTEACMTAIRLARAYTGRSKLLVFEGCYHGHSDGLLVRRGAPRAEPVAPLPTPGGRNPAPRGQPHAPFTPGHSPGPPGCAGGSRVAGVPEAITRETIVIPYNDLDALDESFRQFGDTIACAIVEPVCANMGVVVPGREFLKRLRDLTKQRESLLIFDEVVTGFRLAYGGAQHVFGIGPDLTVLGKIIGGGFPIGALGGPRHLMQRLAPEGPVYHAGTFAGHPLAMVAGLATLKALHTKAPYEHLESLGMQLAGGLREAAKRVRMPIQVNHLGSMLTVFFSESPIRQFATAQQANATRFARFANHLRKAGVLIPPSPFEAWFLSVAHTQAMIEYIIRISSDAFGHAATGP